MKYNIIGLSLALFLLGVFTPQKAEAQSKTLHLNFKAPYSYNVGFYSRFHDRLGAFIDVEVITVPAHATIPGAMKLFGARNNLANILKTPLEGGFGFDLGGHYYFGKGHRLLYVSVGANYINLTETSVSDEDANKAFVIDLSSNSIPTGAVPEILSKEPLTLYSHFLQVTAAVGRTIPLQSKSKELQLEIGIMKTVASHHRLYSDYRYLSAISEDVNTEMQDMMMKYGFFPFVRIVYNFHFETF